MLPRGFSWRLSSSVVSSKQNSLFSTSRKFANNSLIRTKSNKHLKLNSFKSFVDSRLFLSTRHLNTLSKLPHSRQVNLFKHNSNRKMSTEAEVAPIECFRKDYKPSPYKISEWDLDFNLDEVDTIVTAYAKVIRTAGAVEDLSLDGEEVSLVSVKLNTQELKPTEYILEKEKLIIPAATIQQYAPEENFVLNTVVRLHPEKNLALSGLYKSGKAPLLSTQCEAQGFRRITFSLDRPDVLSIFRVRLEASKEKYPVLLSNGNRLESGDIEGTGKHWALWLDPHPKPSYLFALVAGDLASIHGTYTTTSGRVVQLGIYSLKANADKLDHAMYSIIESMKWDERTFGLECDLDVFNIVATDDFNMGAMENKGLNIFNSALLLADSKTATDLDYERILGVIGHEYFHNWTGNRVTVRDWFQLTLKEGLTVFRDQWFSSDLTSAAVKRIEDVRLLRSRQFAEDSGPMSHPIRPESYISMDNFYTATVYEKGSEVIGVYKTLLGEEGFKKGMKLYFERHDGKAVTCDDFREAMADANGVDLSQMDKWYSQAGTPVVDISQTYDAATKKFTLKATQYTPTTPGTGQSKEEKKPTIIPLVTGLLHPVTGQELVPSQVLVLKKTEQEFVFENLDVKPIVSTLRGFSAPVNLNIDQTDEELVLLMAHDTDSFNAWDAGNRYFTRLILDLAKKPVEEIASTPLPAILINAVKSLLSSVISSPDVVTKDRSLIAYALDTPDEMTLINHLSEVNIDSLHKAVSHVKTTLSKSLQNEFQQVYDILSSQNKPYEFNPSEVSRRRLRNTCLAYLTNKHNPNAVKLAKAQFDAADCMTDKIAAINSLASLPGDERTEALKKFYTDAEGNALVLNKWFSIQARADYPTLIEDVIALKSHPDFTLNNPNRARSLLTVFGMNLVHFHRKDGKGYEFLADSIIELDKINPQIAARMMGPFALWKKYDSVRKELMHQQLLKIQATGQLSSDTYEMVTRYLK